VTRSRRLVETLPICVRLTLWCLTLSIWWRQSNALEALRLQYQAMLERAVLVRDVAGLEDAVFRTMSLMPLATDQDRTWWERRVTDELRAEGLQHATVEPLVGDVRVGAFQIDRLIVTVPCSFRELLVFLTWLEETQPRPRIANIALDRTPKGDVATRIDLEIQVLSPRRKP
jgi:hypothetical protein